MLTELKPGSEATTLGVRTAKSLTGLNWLDSNVGFDLPYAINATPIPKPSSVGLFFGGSWLLAARLWKRGA